MRTSYVVESKDGSIPPDPYGDVVSGKRALDKVGAAFRLVRRPDGKVLAEHDQRMLKALAAQDEKDKKARELRHGKKWSAASASA